MTSAALIWPVLVQAGLTFTLLFWMGGSRVQALRRREVKVADIALGQRAWPQRVTQISNAFQNQLELPMLLYVLVALALITGKADATLVMLAWMFVALRLLHALIHTTYNDVRQRFYAYVAGAIVLMAAWAYFGFQLLASA